MSQPLFAPDLVADASAVLDQLRLRGWKLATAESCSGGLIAALFTEVEGSSDVFDRGFVTYSIAAKVDLLGVPPDLVACEGVVSRAVAIAMAEGALNRSLADVTVAVTGVSGPGGGTIDKPVGLVHVAAGVANLAPLHHECRFGAIGRSEVRLASVRAALDLIAVALRPTC
jgi:nicotinamide-nucleotide amidase